MKVPDFLKVAENDITPGRSLQNLEDVNVTQYIADIDSIEKEKADEETKYNLTLLEWTDISMTI